MSYRLLLMAILAHICYASIPPADRCVVIKHDVFENCSKTKRSFRREESLFRDLCTTGDDFANEKACKKTYRLTYLRRQLFTLNILVEFRKAIRGCCGECTGYQKAFNETVTKLEHLDKTVLEGSDIIFPLLATKATNNLYGFHYIPVFEVPTAYYITLRMTQKEKMAALLTGVFNTWPLIVMCILLALLSGFLIWVFEKKDNSAEFPKPIMNGIADGFWWSFVSMTTVGYGDKVPLSLKGRVFAVLWVLIGITIFALLTGSLTNEIVGIDTQAETKILGEKVGGLQHKFHEATMVAQHGGFFDGIEFDDAIIGIMTLIEKLKHGDINGFLISRASYYWFAKVMKYRKYKEQAKKFKLIENELILTEKDYINEKLTLGIMVKHSADYEFLRSYFEDNWLQLQNCQQFSLSARRETYSPSEDDGYLQGLFLPAFYAVLVVYGLILIYLVVTYLYKLYKKDKEKGKGEKSESVSLNDTKAST